MHDFCDKRLRPSCLYVLDGVRRLVEESGEPMRVCNTMYVEPKPHSHLPVALDLPIWWTANPTFQHPNIHVDIIVHAKAYDAVVRVIPRELASTNMQAMRNDRQTFPGPGLPKRCSIGGSTIKFHCGEKVAPRHFLLLCVKQSDPSFAIGWLCTCVLSRIRSFIIQKFEEFV